MQIHLFCFRQKYGKKNSPFFSQYEISLFVPFFPQETRYTVAESQSIHTVKELNLRQYHSCRSGVYKGRGHLWHLQSQGFWTKRRQIEAQASTDMGEGIWVSVRPPFGNGALGIILLDNATSKLRHVAGSTLLPHVPHHVQPVSHVVVIYGVARELQPLRAQPRQHRGKDVAQPSWRRLRPLPHLRPFDPGTCFVCQNMLCTSFGLKVLA